MSIVLRFCQTIHDYETWKPVDFDGAQDPSPTGGEATLQLKHKNKFRHYNNMGNSRDCPWCHSLITERARRPIVRRPPAFICKSFVDALPAANKQRSGRWSAVSAPLPPSVPSTCMDPQPHGPCPGWRGWCCHLPQHGALMLMDWRRSPG